MAGCVASGFGAGRGEGGRDHLETVVLGVSGDGATLVGIVRDGPTGLKTTTSHAVSWKNGIPAPIEAGWGRLSEAKAISRDGRVIVGLVRDVPGALARAVKWKDGICTELGRLGDSYSAAYGVSDDGERIIVNSPDEEGVKACLYEGGTLMPLGTLGGGISFALAISGDGGTVIGMSEDAKGKSRGFVWSGGVMRELPGDGATPESVSDDGRMIAAVRRGEVILFKDGRAERRYRFGVSMAKANVSGQGNLLAITVFEGDIFVVNPREERELRLLSEYLRDQGAEHVEDWDFKTVNAVSDDGAVLAGYGLYRGRGRSWVFMRADGAEPPKLAAMEELRPE